MDYRLKKLYEMGCKVSEGMALCQKDEEFYINCITRTLNDKGYGVLAEQLGNGQASEAFSTAHMLKGIIGNVGLTSMYKTICEIVEILRRGSLEGTMELFTQLMEEKMIYLALMEEA